MVNTTPSDAICHAASPRAGATNWGRKDRKKSTTLGLIALAITPFMNSAPSERSDCTALSTRAPPPLRSAP